MYLMRFVTPNHYLRCLKCFSAGAIKLNKGLSLHFAALHHIQTAIRSLWNKILKIVTVFFVITTYFHTLSSVHMSKKHPHWNDVTQFWKALHENEIKVCAHATFHPPLTRNLPARPSFASAPIRYIRGRCSDPWWRTDREVMERLTSCILHVRRTMLT